VKVGELTCGHQHRYICVCQLIKEERGKAMVSLVDLIVGDVEFNTSKVGKVKDPKAGCYMITADNAQTRNA
jgi:hypothetical protein